MSEWIRFGESDVFQIRMRWVDDPAPPERRPVGHGWSMGQIVLTVGGVNLTASACGDDRQDHVGWYLSPLLGWLAANWVSLLHEQRFAWEERSAVPGAVACRRLLDWLAGDDPLGESNYEQAQAWYRRHGLRAASLGGLFPDLFVRRMGDDIELSWSGYSPEFAPANLVFESGAGMVRVSVMDFARPLWNALQWAAENPPPAAASFQTNIAAFQGKVRSLRELGGTTLGRGYLPSELFDKARSAFEDVGRLDLFDHGDIVEDVPCIAEFSPAVAMYGGVTPELADADVRALRDALVAGHGGSDGDRLEQLVAARRERRVGVPHRDGERFAAELLEDLEVGRASGWINVHAICNDLDIHIESMELRTNSIRGVALAGVGFAPRIVINESHYFNANDAGQRFTIAHELCHILCDRTRARRVAHTSGSWAPAAIEKRANAFAAYLLMPPGLVRKSVRFGERIEWQEVGRLARFLRVNRSPLVEHLYNLHLVDDASRDRLREGLGPN